MFCAPLSRERGGLTAGVCLVLWVLLAQGCSTLRVTDPERTATEQFLMSEAARDAVAKLGTEALRDRAVFVDGHYFVGKEREFVIGELRAHLLVRGVRLVDQRQDAQIVLEMRSGGIGIDRYESLTGVPPLQLAAGQAASISTGAPTGQAGNLITPELAILKSLRQRGFASVAFVAYWRDTGEVVAAAGPYIGQTFRHDWWFLGFGPRSTGNIPTVQPLKE